MLGPPTGAESLDCSQTLQGSGTEVLGSQQRCRREGTEDMVHILTDTTSGLPPEIAAQYGIPVVPQVIHFGQESYLVKLHFILP